MIQLYRLAKVTEFRIKYGNWMDRGTLQLQNFTNIEYSFVGKVACLEKFINKMDNMFLWLEEISMIELFYTLGRHGHPKRVKSSRHPW